MLTEPIEGADPEALLSRYAAGLQNAIEAVDGDVTEAAGIDPSSVRAIEAGEVAELDLEEVSAVLALREGAPDAATLRSTVRDHLLLGMSTGVLTVDRVAARVDGDLEPGEIQGMIEGRYPMTLAQYARIHHAIAAST